MSASESFFITTPIYYVNDAPHIGHAYSDVAVDVLARYHRQQGINTFMLTGTDEHGQKILRTATANGVTPRQWVDKLVAEAWLPMLDDLDIDNDAFVRTTDEQHERVVKRFMQKLYDSGFVYLSEFESLYCVGCEEFKPPSEIVDGTGKYEGQKVCAIHSIPLELLHETNYFFKLSEFGPKLLELYESQPDFIRPQSAKNEVVSFVRQGLTDLSISRTSFDWGVQAPWDDKHIIYVWIDALINYISAIGYGEPDDQTPQYWPGYHVVGKDILRFHAIIWPAMLMAAGLDVPKGIFGTGWLLVGGEKMSKSKLTGIPPREITDVFGSDAFRYYFMRAINFGQDGSFSWEDIHARYNAELANGYGNLASRVVAMVQRYFDGEIPQANGDTDEEQSVRAIEDGLAQRVLTAIEEFRIQDAILEVWKLVDALNGYITATEPWKLAKDEAQRERLATVLATAIHGLGEIAVLLSPVMPLVSEKLWQAIGGSGAVAEYPLQDAHTWQGSGRIAPLDLLFPRVDVAVEQA